MAAPILHIKDAYYFEVPKALWRSDRESREEFPDWWIKLDPEYQRWEAEQLYPAVKEVFGDAVPPKDELIHDYEHWKHEDHDHFGKPFESYLMATQEWFSDPLTKDAEPEPPEQDSAEAKAEYETALKEYKADVAEYEEYSENWAEAKAGVVDFESYNAKWSEKKIAGYNKALSGKVLIPQPFATLKNAYEKESGFAISKYMIIEVVVAILLIAVFSWLANRMRSGVVPRGRCWNLLEVILVYFRDQVARPSIDSHDHGHDSEPHADADEELHLGDSPIGEELKEASHGHHTEHHDGDRFVPLLWTTFLFILGCNLFGLVPWLGSPTGALGCTGALALATFAVVVFSGMMQFGPVGWVLNQIPSMELPFVLAIFLKPMILVIEIFGLLVKHGVLAIRLLANMVAGHLIILGIMGLAFTADSASSLSGPLWGLVAVLAILGTVAINLLEIFVAFLQAFIFTFLSALFIGASIHKH